MRLTPLPSFSRSLHPSASFSLRSSDVAPSNIALARRFRPRSSCHQRASDALCRAPFRPSLPEFHRAPGPLPPAPRQRSRLSLIQSAFHQRVPLPESVSGPARARHRTLGFATKKGRLPTRFLPRNVRFDDSIAGLSQVIHPRAADHALLVDFCNRSRSPSTTVEPPEPRRLTTVSRRESNSGDRAPFEAPPVEVSLARGSICYRIRAPSTAIAHREASPQLVLPRTSPVANVMQ